MDRVHDYAAAGAGSEAADLWRAGRRRRTVWADDLRLLVDGKPVASVARLEPERTALDLDKEFDAGSGIAVKDLTKTQIANLAMLGKVWGFLKYHHPAIAAGKRHWDYDLFRVLPRVLSASDVPAARSVVRRG